MKTLAFVLLAVFAVGIWPARAEMISLSDEELDQIQAGGVQFDLNVNPDAQSVDFSFSLGPTFGNGSAALSPITPVSTLTLNGPTNLSNAVFHVDNMVFNLNICAMCRADTIIQKGIGVPITINTTP